MDQKKLISKIIDASSKIKSKNGCANWILTNQSISDKMDDIFGLYICEECCSIGKVVPSSGWGDPSRHEKTCQVCRNKKICHLMTQSDKIKIKIEIRNSKIDDLLISRSL